MVRLRFKGVPDTSISITSYSNKSNIKIIIQSSFKSITVCLLLKKSENNLNISANLSGQELPRKPSNLCYMFHYTF